MYHCSVKPVQRSKGRSATAAAAYRAREVIQDERQGMIFDYSAKQDLEHEEIIGWDGTRSELWNEGEMVEPSKDATTAREYEVALPRELSTDQRIALAREYGQWLHERHNVAVDICLHTDENDNNPHAHILTTTRAPEGRALGEKVAREWSDSKRKKNGLDGRKSDLVEAREKWATVANRHLEMAQVSKILDHRSFADQGIGLTPSIKLGPAVIAMEEKGIRTDRGDLAQAILQSNQTFLELQALELEIKHERPEPTTAQPNRATTQDTELRRTERADRAVSHEHGNAGRGLEGSHEPSPQPPQRELRFTDAGFLRNDERRPEINQRPERINPSGQEHYLSRFKAELLEVCRSMRTRFATGYDRILALAAPIGKPATVPDMGHQNRPLMENRNIPRPPANSQADGVERANRMKPDRTYQAVKRQLEQMGGDSFMVGIQFDDKFKVMEHKHWSKAEVLANIPKLKRDNVRGGNIFIQPKADDHNLILVDDVSFEDLEKMAANGHKAALSVETSPDNYQAWVKMPEPLSEDDRKYTAKLLAQTYEADFASVGANHYGRLAGFTNQKPKHQNKRGQHPFVLLRESNGQVATAGRELLEQAREMPRIENSKRIDHLKRTVNITPEAERVFVSESISLEAKYGHKIDRSRADWMITKKMLKAGFEPSDIAGTMVKHSPEIENRKRDINVDDYVNRTINNAQEAIKTEIEQERRPRHSRSPGNRSPGFDR